MSFKQTASTMVEMVIPKPPPAEQVIFNTVNSDTFWLAVHELLKQVPAGATNIKIIFIVEDVVPDMEFAILFPGVVIYLVQTESFLEGETGPVGTIYIKYLVPEEN